MIIFPFARFARNIIIKLDPPYDLVVPETHANTPHIYLKIMSGLTRFTSCL